MAASSAAFEAPTSSAPEGHTFKPSKTTGRNQYSAVAAVEIPIALSLTSPPRDVFVVRAEAAAAVRAFRAAQRPVRHAQSALALARQLEQQGYMSNTEKGMLKQVIATASQHTLNILLAALLLFQDDGGVPELTETLKVLVSSKNLI